MYSYNRRQYINREPENKIEKNIPEANENSDAALKALALESLKLLSENIEEIKNSINKLDNRMVDLSHRISNLETHFDNNNDIKRIQTQPMFDEIKTKFETEKNKVENKHEEYQPDYENSAPMMPGSGFANITVDYLRNLNKKR